MADVLPPFFDMAKRGSVQYSIRKFGIGGLKSFLINAIFTLTVIFPASAAEKVVLQLRWDHQFQFAGYYAAKWQGYYDRAGLDVEIHSAIQPGKKARRAIKEVTEGRADFGIGAGDILVARDKGAPIVIVASIFQKSPVAVMSKPEQGISSPADLLKITVHSRRKDMWSVEYYAMLRAEGIDLTRGALKYSGNRGGVDAGRLIDGKIDAYASYYLSTLWKAHLSGIRLSLLRPSSYGVDFYGDSLFTSEHLIESNPELVERFVAASLEGWRYAQENPMEIADRISSELPRNIAIKNLRDFNRFYAAEIAKLALYPVVELGHVNPGRWRKMHEAIKYAGMITGDFDPVASIFDPELLKRQRQDRAANRILYSLAVLFLIAVFSGFWLLLKRIQDRRRADKVLRESEERLRLVTDAIPAAIAYIDSAVHCRFANKNYGEMLGFDSNDIIGMPLKEVIGEKLFDSTADHRTAAMAGEEQLFEDTMPDGSGGVRHLQVAYIPHFMYGGGVEGFYAMIQDISERKKAEDQIKASLAEKEVLLREIHHLVKNNLQVISGMLWLQADADDDAHTVEVLQDSRRRVMLMAQIHESLHLQDNLNVINARDLLSTLVANTKASGGAVSEHLSFDIDVDDIALDVDQANAYGQIISELISNSMKHAFATGQPGKVEVSLRRGDAGVTELTVADDGGGLPKNIDLQQTKTLGLQLVRSLAAKLEGEIHIDRSGGTRIRINFPAEPS